MNQELTDSVYDMEVPSGPEGKLVICGDTHGQLADFLWVLKQNGEPSENTGYLLNGDVADRGDDASEILIITLLYKLMYPKRIMINRCVCVYAHMCVCMYTCISTLLYKPHVPQKDHD